MRANDRVQLESREIVAVRFGARAKRAPGHAIAPALEASALRAEAAVAFTIPGGRQIAAPRSGRFTRCRKRGFALPRKSGPTSALAPTDIGNLIEIKLLAHLG